MKKLIMTVWMSVVGVVAMSQPTISVGLLWQPSPEPDVTNYRVHRGEASRLYDWKSDVGLMTSTVASGMQPGKTYFFAVTALNSWNMESDFSNEVMFTAPTGDPVTAITGWSGKRENGKATIIWDQAPPGQYVTRWRILWSRKGSTDVQELWAAAPKFEFDAPDRSAAFTVFIQAEGLQGLGPAQMIEVPKFPDPPVSLEIEPNSMKVVYRTLIEP